MRRAEALLVGLLLVSACSRTDPGIPVSVGAVRLLLAPPRGWEHVDNGGRHEFRSGDQHFVLLDQGIALPETLAAAIQASRARLEREDAKDELTSLRWRDDPVLTARSLDEQQGFWRYWVSVSTDPTRRTTVEMAWAVDTLLERSRGLAPLGAQALARWVVAQRIDTLGYQIDHILPTESHGRTWWVARTWSRGAHLFERRYASAVVEGRLLVLESGPILGPPTLATFDALIASLAPAGPTSR